MGIPRLYSILTSQWPSLVQTPSLQDSCDALFLDMSSFLHSCLSLSSIEEEILLLVNQFICRLIEVSRPKQMVFMAFDGVPPLAKLKEQFERRTMAMTSSLLNSHILTPGTAFLQRLETSVVELAERLALEKDNSALDVVISGPSVPGEGEHKIMRHLESIKGDTLLKVVIYGMDADLIVMSMPISSPEVNILRERPMSRGQPIANKEFEFFSIPRFRAKIWLSCLNPTEAEMNGIMRDLGFLFTIFGNDFTPTPDGLELSKANFMKYVELLRPIHRQKKCIVKNGLIQYDGLFLLLKSMAKEEQTNFKVKNPIKQADLSTRVLELQLAGLSLREKKSSVKSFIEQVEDERYKKWRESKYMTAYKVKPSEIGKICEDYLKTMRWVTKYYTEGDCNTWSYEHSFTPRFTDILLHFKEGAEDDTWVGSDLLLGPLHQLALVLPERSKELLPKVYRDSGELQKLLASRSSNSAGAFHQENIQKAIDIMKDLDKDLSESEEQRNTKGDLVRIHDKHIGSESGSSPTSTQEQAHQPIE